MRITVRSVIRVMALALAGLAVAAALAVAASRLSSQRIGLSSEPSSAGNRLVPASFRGAGTTGRTGAPEREGGREPLRDGRRPGPAHGRRTEHGDSHEDD